MTDETRLAHEATGRPGHEAAPLAQHASAARILARGERGKAEAEAAVIKADAEAARLLRVEAGHLELAEARAAARAARKAERREAAVARRARLGQLVRAAVTRLRAEAAAVYSLGIYGISVGVAGSAQAVVAHDQFGWPWPGAVAGAAFVEGLALSMALTAHRLRLKGERALAPRMLTWAAAGFAAWVNYTAHASNALEASVLAASSLAGITVWEIRTSARSRDALREAGQIADVRARIGWDFRLRYPIDSFWAWSAQVASTGRLSRSEAIEEGRRLRADRAARKAGNKADGKAKPNPAPKASRPAPEAKPRPTTPPKATERAAKPTAAASLARTDQAAAAKAERVAALSEAFPAYVPTRREAQAQMGWTSNPTTDGAIKALRAMREADQAPGGDSAGDNQEGSHRDDLATVGA